MTYKTGTATGHEALLEDFRKWVTGYGTYAAAVPGGGNTGDGTVTDIRTTTRTTTETWTLTCTAAASDGGTFSVSGSVSGMQTGAATVGTPYLVDDGSFGFTINDGSSDFVAGGTPDTFTIATTEGEMVTDGYEWINLTYLELGQWTRSGTTATFTWPGHKLAAGQTIVVTESSDTGAITNATKTITGVSGDDITFTCSNAGATSGYLTATHGWNSEVETGLAWTRSSTTATVTLPAHTLAVGDTVTVSASSDTGAITNATKTITAVATNTISFACIASGATSGTLTLTLNETHLYLKGQGNGGTDEIFVNLRSYQNSGAGYYNIELRGATGFSGAAGMTRITQAGISSLVDLCLISGSMNYWFIANGRAFRIVAKASTVYESAYAGFILPTGLPSEYTYPLAIGGSQGQTRKLYSASSGADGYTHNAFFNAGSGSSTYGALYLRDKTGTWRNFYNKSSDSAVWSGNYNRTFPYGGSRSLSTTKGSPIYPNLNAGVIDASSTYTLFPVSLISRVAGSPTGTKDIFGDFEGVFHVSGHNNASENIVQISGVDHLVIQNTYHTDKDEYAAFALE